MTYYRFPSPQVLDLEVNDIGHADLSTVFQNMQKMVGLRTLNLRDNGMGEGENAKKNLEALGILTTTLKQLNVRHTCPTDF